MRDETGEKIILIVVQIKCSSVFEILESYLNFKSKRRLKKEKTSHIKWAKRTHFLKNQCL